MTINTVAILGGGISGLSAAHYLLKHSLKYGNQISKVFVVEQQPQFGGWLKTAAYGNKNNGDYFELGPRTINLNSYAGINTIALADEIGLSDNVKSVSKTSKSFNKRYIAIDGKLHRLPNKIVDLFTYQKPFKPFVYYIVKELMTSPVKLDPQLNDISVHDFFQYRFGDEIANYVANSICIGITGGNSRELSMRSMFPNVLQNEQTLGSVVKSLSKKQDIHQDLVDNLLVKRSIQEKWSVYSFDTGIQTLANQIHSFLQERYSSIIEFIPRTEITSVEFIPGRVKLTGKQDANQPITLDVDHIFSAIPASNLAKLLPENNGTLKSALSSIPTAHMAVVCLEFEGQVIQPDFGFGFLVPSVEKSSILGVTFDSCIFPSSNSKTTKLTVMLGGYRFVELFGPPDQVDSDQLYKVSLDALKLYLGINTKPINKHIAVHKSCIPQYTIGHQDRLVTIENETKNMNISLVGASYRGFSVPDCIYNAKTQVESWLQNNANINGKIN